MENDGVKKNKAVFLDRDGTIIKLAYYEDAETIDTVSKPEQVELTPDIGEVLRYLKGLGYLLILISNQQVFYTQVDSDKTREISPDTL